MTAVLLIAFGSIQAGFIVGFKVSQHLSLNPTPARRLTKIPIETRQYGNVPAHHKDNFILASAVLAAVLLSLGVLRHYWDIYEERTVRGISWGFVFLDALGDLASLLAIGTLLQSLFPRLSW